MAILEKFEVTVQVEKQDLREYEDADSVPDSAAFISNFIEAVADTKFKFQYKLHKGYDFRACDYLQWKTFIDGELVGRPEIFKRDYTATETLIKSRKAANVKVGQVWATQAFKFGKLNTREASPGDDPAEFKTRYGGLGTMRVEVWRREQLPELTDAICSNQLASPAAASEGHGPDKLQNAVVPEKALKGQAISLAARLGRIENSRFIRAPRMKCHRRSIDTKPIAVFIFKYRSRSDLRILGVLKRTASPTSLEDRPVEDLTPNEMRELLRRQREGAEKQKDIKIKREGATERKAASEGDSTLSGPAPKRRAKRSRTVAYFEEDDEEDAAEVGSSFRRGPQSWEGVEVIDLFD